MDSSNNLICVFSTFEQCINFLVINCMHRMQEHVVWFGEADFENLSTFPSIVFKAFSLVDLDRKLIFANTTPYEFDLALAHKHFIEHDLCICEYN